MTLEQGLIICFIVLILGVNLSLVMRFLDEGIKLNDFGISFKLSYFHFFITPVIFPIILNKERKLVSTTFMEQLAKDGKINATEIKDKAKRLEKMLTSPYFLFKIHLLFLKEFVLNFDKYVSEVMWFINIVIRHKTKKTKKRQRPNFNILVEFPRVALSGVAEGYVY